MKPPEKLSEKDFQQAALDLQNMEAALQRVITGQSSIIREMLITFIAGGHILLEGLPGLAKTHLAKALAAVTDLNFSRIQCTPDLMPADIIGCEILLHDENSSQVFNFQPGPIFSQLVLVDEINRSTPKTQSSLLEAMQEQQVTYNGKSYPLPSPFRIIATQNPIEIEGTYPLPEAQLDRFMSKLKIGFPDSEALFRIVDIALDSEPSTQLQPVLSEQRLRQIMQLCRNILISDNIKHAAVKLILATHPTNKGEKHQFSYGASPRGLQSLIRAARVHALMQGRLQLDLDDLQAMAMPTLRHRVLLSLQSELEGVDSDEVLSQLITNWRKNI